MGGEAWASSSRSSALDGVRRLAAAYTRWAGVGTSFHYVSASPWQLYSSLAEFFDGAGYPRGSVHLKQFRWKDTSFFSLFEDPIAYKTTIIRGLVSSAPRRSFVLVGDSGEKDPEVYGGIFRESPTQVRHIYIRDVTAEARDGARYAEAFKDVPVDRWTLFTDHSVLPQSL